MPFKQKQWSQSLPRGGVRAVAHQHSKGAFTLEGGDISQGKRVGLSACTSQQGCGRAAGHARQPIQLALSSLWLYLLLCSHHIPAVWLAKSASVHWVIPSSSLAEQLNVLCKVEQLQKMREVNPDPPHPVTDPHQASHQNQKFQTKLFSEIPWGEKTVGFFFQSVSGVINVEKAALP